MAFSVDIRPNAQDFIKQQRSKHQRQIRKKIETLRDEPRPPNATRLRGEEGFWRVRTGDFRIVYTVEDEKLLVVVVIAGNRKDIYGKLRRAGLID